MPIQLPLRERTIMAVMLILLSALAWVSLVRFPFGMTDASMSAHAQMSMPHTHAWRLGDAALIFAMWVVMMVAMMVPAAVPMIATYSGLRRLRADGDSLVAATAFVAGYLIIWILFSLGATMLQWGFHTVGWISAGHASAAAALSGSLLILAGAYQFTRWKQVCLSRCSTPLSFLMVEWREGIRGALLMGSRHGAYCLGCCWALMLLLFVAGVMNFVWVAALAAFVLIEKLFPVRRRITRAAGALALGSGAWILVRALVS